MKTTLLISLLMPLLLSAQERSPFTWDPNNPEHSVAVESPRRGKSIDIIIPALATFAGGFSDGINSTLIFHYGNFKKKHPGADPEFWDPDISWKNKYRNWDQGNTKAAFPLSKSLLVSITDGQHLTAAAARWSSWAGFYYRGAILGHKKKWYVYFLNGMAMYAINRVGFEMSYNMYYR